MPPSTLEVLKWERFLLLKLSPVASAILLLQFVTSLDSSLLRQALPTLSTTSSIDASGQRHRWLSFHSLPPFVPGRWALVSNR